MYKVELLRGGKVIQFCECVPCFRLALATRVTKVAVIKKMGKKI